VRKMEIEFNDVPSRVETTFTPENESLPKDNGWSYRRMALADVDPRYAPGGEFEDAPTPSNWFTRAEKQREVHPKKLGVIPRKSPACIDEIFRPFAKDRPGLEFFDKVREKGLTTTSTASDEC